MKLGTISWTLGLDDLDELFSKVEAIGYSGLQFCGDFNAYAAEDVKAKAQKYNIELIGYDPLNCKPETNKQAKLEQSVLFYKKVIDYGVALGVPMVTLQGLSFWTKQQPNYEAAMLQIVAAVQELCVYANGKNMLLTYEACCHYEVPQVHTAKELLRIYNDAGSPKNLKLVLDSFHMNITEHNMVEPIKTLGKDLLYNYHVSDSGRGGIGTGHIDYLSQYNALKAIGFDGYICFEIVTPECRPYKFPMSNKQMQVFLEQSKYSINIWKAIMNR